MEGGPPIRSAVIAGATVPAATAAAATAAAAIALGCCLLRRPRHEPGSNSSSTSSPAAASAGEQKESEGTAIVSSLYIYPVKSTAENSVQCAEISSTGLTGDRVFQVVSASGNASGRPKPWDKVSDDHQLFEKFGLLAFLWTDVVQSAAGHCVAHNERGVSSHHATRAARGCSTSGQRSAARGSAS